MGKVVAKYLLDADHGAFECLDENGGRLYEALMATSSDWLEKLFCERCGRYREPAEVNTQRACPNCGSQPGGMGSTICYEVPVRPTALLLELQTAVAERKKEVSGSAPTATEETTDLIPERTRQVVRGAESCPSCNGQELFYETVQMRSADEGQTILYQCCRCRTRFTQHS